MTDPLDPLVINLRARLTEAEQIAAYNLERVAQIDAYCRGWMQRALEAELELAKLKGRLN